LAGLHPQIPRRTRSVMRHTAQSRWVPRQQRSGGQGAHDAPRAHRCHSVR
jgi:hypothetical protein